MIEAETRTMDAKHLKYMLLVDVALFALLVATGISVGNALLIALVLSCPLMMLVMLLAGGHGAEQIHEQRPKACDDEDHRSTHR
jgi:hypothetical protein